MSYPTTAIEADFTELLTNAFEQIENPEKIMENTDVPDTVQDPVEVITDHIYIIIETANEFCEEFSESLRSQFAEQLEKLELESD